MRIPAQSASKEASRITHISPLRKRTMTMLAALALVFGCILTGMSAATAPTADLPGGMRMPSTSESLILACGGACPGICPCPYELKDDSMLNF